MLGRLVDLPVADIVCTLSHVSLEVLLQLTARRAVREQREWADQRP